MTDIKLNGSGTAAIHFGYDNLSRRTAITYINGCESVLSYAINNDLLSLEHTFTGSSVTYSYGYNKVHQATSVSVDDADYVWPAPTAFSKTVYPSATNLNQYPAVGSTAFDYDENGNLTSGPCDANYDELSRVTQIVKGGTTNSYWNDPLNRQAQKESNSVKTSFLYDGAQIIAEYDDMSALTNRYIPSTQLDDVLVQISGSTTTFLHKDRLGSTIAQTDDSGAVLTKHRYSPFGETPSLTGTIFGFTGQRYDAEIGLYNYKARYYDPAIGRFLQTDPLSYSAGDMNLYSYVANDPVNNTDPFGLILVTGWIPIPVQFRPIPAIPSIITGFSSGCGCSGGGTTPSTPSSGGGGGIGGGGGVGGTGGGGSGTGGGVVFMPNRPKKKTQKECEDCCEENFTNCLDICLAQKIPFKLCRELCLPSLESCMVNCDPSMGGDTDSCHNAREEQAGQD